MIKTESLLYESETKSTLRKMLSSEAYFIKIFLKNHRSNTFLKININNFKFF